MSGQRTRLRVALGALALVSALLAGVALALVFDSPYDNDVPGIVLPESPFSSSLTETTTVGLEDMSDVYAVNLGRNELLDVTMTLDDPEANDDFDLYLYPPNASKPVVYAYEEKRFVAASESPVAGGPERIRYVPTRSREGTSYVHVYCFYADGDDDAGGSGAYTITWTKMSLPAPAVASKAPAVSAYRAATISGAVQLDGQLLEGLRFDVLARPAGTSAWKRVSGGVTGSGGTFKATVKPTKRTGYRIRAGWGTASNGGPEVGYGYGPIMTVKPKVHLAFKSVPKVAYRRRSFPVSGYLKPSHSKSTRRVRIEAERRENGRWVKRKTTYVRSSGTSFSGRITLPSRGTWRIRARVKADSLHAATSSTWRRVTIR